MGSGQMEEALSVLDRAVQCGAWVCLKNLHLVIPWLQDLEKYINSDHESRHKGFRLWLTTEAHDHFPSMLLRDSLKITFESPPGVKRNLLRTFSSWSPQYLKRGGKTRAQMMFLLAWYPLQFIIFLTFSLVLLS